MKIITLSICIFCQFTLPAFAEDTVQSVRIAVKEFPPFVFKNPRGFSVDMARIICERHGLKPEFVYYNTVPAVLKAVATGECDFKFSGTNIAAEREKLVDFSYPIFDSGLIVAVKTTSENATRNFILQYNLPSYTKPSIICPFFGDQPFWGRQVERIGVGPSSIPQKRFTVEHLCQAIKVVMNDSALRQNAAALGNRL